MSPRDKPLEFCGGALAELRAFPADARQDAGYQLGRLQKGEEPDDWKPMTGLGSGVREIRIRDGSDAFRVIYVAKFEDAIYVLRCFQKKTEKTAKRDAEIARDRFRQLMKERDYGR